MKRIKAIVPINANNYVEYLSIKLKNEDVDNWIKTMEGHFNDIEHVQIPITKNRTVTISGDKARQSIFEIVEII